uniref:Uncharacterized protein n=1 Tax=Glossina pallidipes TaxID=7398 RepID=A0A1A9Z319_GLOPL
MGKCISKNPTSLTIATISEKNLAAASHILGKYSESSEYVALKDGQGNQLYEYIAVNDRTNGNVVVITADCQDSAQNEKQKQKQEGQKRQHESYVANNNQEIIVENICTDSTDRYTCVSIQQKIECDDKANITTYNDEYDDVVESLLDVGKHIATMSFSSTSSSSSSYVAATANLPVTPAVAICSNISPSKLYDYDVHLANSNNNNHNYYTDIQHSMVQLRLYRQRQWQEQQQQIQMQRITSDPDKIDAYDSYNIKNFLKQQKLKKILKLSATASATATATSHSSKLKSSNDLKHDAPSKASSGCECSLKNGNELVMPLLN